ncbi:hypothetical protein V6N13_075274 [Hibiscus sabdariffa]
MFSSFVKQNPRPSLQKVPEQISNSVCPVSCQGQAGCNSDVDATRNKFVPTRELEVFKDVCRHRTTDVEEKSSMTDTMVKTDITCTLLPSEFHVYVSFIFKQTNKLEIPIYYIRRDNE